MKLNNYKLNIAVLLAIILLTTNQFTVAAEAAGATIMPGMVMPNATAATGHAVGLIQTINTITNTVTIATEAIPERNWPAMTMDYKVAENAAANVRAGQKVNFEFAGEGMDVTITKISAVE